MTKKSAVLGAALGVLCVGCSQEAKIVEIEPTKIEFRVLDDSTTLRARALDSKGNEVTEGGSLTFSSESPSIADVSSTGEVRPKGNGDTAIVATAPNGAKGEVFVSVCLPKDLICEPKDELDIRVGSGAPIKCHVENCREEIIQDAKVSFDILAKNVALADTAVSSSVKGISAMPVTGSMIGDTEATVTAYNFEKKIHIKVEEALPIPGEEEYKASQKGGKGKGGNDPYSGGKGAFGHILDNMKFN
jgi:hypothetical protein